MPRAGGRPANPFWTYSLRLYRRPDVAAACIALQDRLGVDVNVLLFCLWAGHRGVALPPKTMTLIGELSRLWSTNVVGGLRQVRRFLKPLGLPALRGQVARVELAAERVEQDLLVRLLPAARRRRAMPLPERAELAARNLAHYLRRHLPRRGASLKPADTAHLLTLLAAAFPSRGTDLRRLFHG
ncbi:MAG TPA: TIGR02444 family protein [Alphaproteobacteria bacterium]